MSTKTNFKRVALVAVAALGLGVLTSVAPANAAIAASDVTVTAKTDLVNAGACVISSTAGKIGGTFVNGSAVQLTNAQSDTTAAYLAITGPAIWVSASLAEASGLFPSASATVTPTTITDATTAAGDLYTLRLTGEGTVTVTVSATSSTAAVDVITITSVASCLTSTLSVADSNFTIVSLAEADTNSTEGDAWESNYNGVDTTDANVVAVNATGYARAALTNAYGAALSSKPIVATATSGCWVAVEASDTTAGVASAPAASTAVMTGSGADLTLAVKAATAGTAVNCTITLTWNGLTVGTKSFKLQGVAAKVVVSDVTVGEKGGVGYWRATVTDALGNALPSIAIDNSSSETNNAASLQVVSDASSNSTSTGSSTNATTGAVYGKTPAITTTTIGNSSVGEYTCTSKGGAAKLTVRALASGVTYVTSAPFDVYCGGASIDTWSISLDKASYSPGEIATLTVSSKDADGNFAQSLLALGASTSSFGGMTFVTAPTDTDKFNSGAGFKTYQLSVGTTEGSFVGTFKLTGTTDTSAKTVSYTVKSTSTAVSNADVLKAIVSLIASINKQIAALQKALLKR
jgi:trimeric autotransporter adhesin